MYAHEMSYALLLKPSPELRLDHALANRRKLINAFTLDLVRSVVQRVTKLVYITLVQPKREAITELDEARLGTITGGEVNCKATTFWVDGN